MRKKGATLSGGSLMQRVVRFVTFNWNSDVAVEWITNIMIATHGALGVAVLAGGVPRFPFPTYQPLYEMVHGETWIWGVWILLSACLMMVPLRLPRIIGIWIGMVWHILWCVAFSIAIVRYPTSAAVEAVSFGAFAWINAALLTVVLTPVIARWLAKHERG